jgi:hypothetical protein
MDHIVQLKMMFAIGVASQLSVEESRFCTVEESLNLLAAG